MLPHSMLPIIDFIANIPVLDFGMGFGCGMFFTASVLTLIDVYFYCRSLRLDLQDKRRV